MKRIDWLDTMKGIAIFLVVLRHVFIGMHLMDHPVSVWIHLFHMPFFFLLSGFLAVKTLKQSVWQNYKKKFVALMLPFFTCGLTMSYLLGTMNDYTHTLMHNGFWFLLSLFTCWLIFLPLAKVLQRFRYGRDIVVEAIVLILPFFIGNQLMKLLPSDVNDILSFPLTFSMYRYFIVGYLMGKVFFTRDKYVRLSLIERLGGASSVIHNVVYPASVIVFALLTIGSIEKLSIIANLPEGVYQLVLSITLFFIIYGVNEHIGEKASKVMRFVGRNTLPIYLFHFYIVYEFLFELILTINGVYQTLWAILVSCVVIAITLAFTLPIRTNKTLKLIFMGLK